ncbi:helix-turn-helix transcriptional regulator [Kribbella albertanoniae]|uniref:helix-turn-helix transcriptional regulator n=1 Tax=Kribbella albertanoniae TaxID=1266829 RepID=UPI001404B0A3|nr:helix-turn-helix transcriptional regulator [Kribbella albertanoniae]
MAQFPRPLSPQASVRDAFGAAVRDLRVRRHLSQADLGSLVFVSKDQIGKIEKAQRWPTAELIADLDRELGAAGLLQAFEPGLRSQRRIAQPPLRRVETTLERAALDWLTTSTGEVRILGSRDDEAVDEEDVAAVVQQLARFRELDHQHGAGRTHQLVSGYVAVDLEHLLTRVPVDEATATKLYATAAGFWELVGYQAIDLGRDDHARDCYLRALELTTAAGDRLYGGYLLAVSSAHLALHGGDVDQALRMARTGLHGTSDIADPTARSAFEAVLARGEARRGDEKAATKALLRAETQLASAAPGNAPAWIGYFTPAYLADEMAHCFHDLGHQVLAQEQAGEALSQIASGHVRRLAIDTALMASSLARAGDPEQACVVGREAVDLAAQTSSARSRHRIDGLRQDLVPYSDLKPVVEFGDYVRFALSD